MTAHLREAELLRLFNDWSIPVILRRVEQELDSDFDDISESATNFEVQAVLLPIKTSPTSRTAMQHLAAECEFLLRSDEIPVDLALTACRLLAAGREWAVIQVTRSADGRTVHVRAQAT